MLCRRHLPDVISYHPVKEVSATVQTAAELFPF